MESFQALINDWFRQLGPTSNLSEMIGSPAFRRIAKGNPAVPLLLRELKREPSFLVLALAEITGENPVPRAARGKVKEMATAWLAWGESNGKL
jgi:hypothetical protein